MSMMLGGSNARLKSKAKMRPPKKYGPDQAIDETWSRLASAIKEIQQHNASKLSFEEHYRYSYNMVLYKHGDKLYGGVKKLIAEHLDDLASREIVPTFPRSGVMSSNLTMASSSKSMGMESLNLEDTGNVKVGSVNAQSVEMVLEGERFLKALKSVWEDHISSMSKLRQILKYMDKVYTPLAGVLACYELGLTLFSYQIIHSPNYPIQTNLISTLLSQIHFERTGEVISRSSMRDIIDILALLRVPDKNRRFGSGKSVYVVDFEPVFLKKSEAFYSQEAESSLQTLDASAYLRQVERRITEEHARSSAYLVSTWTLTPLLSILDNHLLSNHLDDIMRMPGSGLLSMIDDDRMSDLARLYTLFGRPGVTEGLEALKRDLKLEIHRRGNAINLATMESDSRPEGNSEQKAVTEPDASGPKKSGLTGAAAIAAALRWVQEVVDLKDRFDRILKEAFAEDKGIQVAMNEAFQTFINQNKRCQEFISLFIDENLKKGLKGKTDEEVDAVLEKTIVLFRFIIDKDVFERYYKAHLAKRLLNARSVSEDAERNMVARLKAESGYQFTQKLEGMFNDMRLSTDMMKGYQKSVAGKTDASTIDLNVTVLTSTFWPGEASATTCVFPSALSRSMAEFERYYHHRHSGRRLTWQSNHGTADVRVAFKARKHELNVSTHCLVILLLFEELVDGDDLSLQDIKAATQIPENDLARSLQSLACGKFRVLTKSPKGREVGPNDRFSFNSSFTCPLAKIKIQTIVGKVENNEERAETQERIDEERRHQIEACIVRIMKARKTLSHNDLVNEVIRQLMTRFTPTPTVIKKRIEGLIDREYLERNDMKSYNYLA